MNGTAKRCAWQHCQDGLHFSALCAVFYNQHLAAINQYPVTFKPVLTPIFVL
jgi:hypothetical protein